MKSRKMILGKNGGVGLRKIIRVGNSSVAVCIPEDFLYRHGLKAGDEIGLVWNGCLKLVPVKEAMTKDEERI